MYFKKLEVFGFKSFADKTNLNFEPGITAIVGPNGCGKSNVFDAIRWVLGEQSVKELRGTSMEDVIFSGTDKKPALGFAEVNLTFSNESRLLPVETDEVLVSRRLYRSGESEYLLNKNTVRLRDIQELFMGTGIGAEAYSLIQQGKVDLVVSAKPEDRRIIIDEASGITKYKAKKREALNKLKDTENNLLRVNDIIIEVKRQIASIERQANKARRYKDEFEKLKKLEIQKTRYEIDNFSNKKGTISKGIIDLKEKEQQFTDELRELNSSLETQTNLLEELEQKINDINAEEIKLDGQIDINNKQIGFNEERIESLINSAERTVEKKNQLIERCRTQQEKIEELKAALSELAQDVEQKAELLTQEKDKLTSVENIVAVSKKEIKENEERILQSTSKQVSAKNELTEVMKEVQGCLARKRRLELENSKISSEKQQVDDRLQTTSTKIDSLTEKVSQLKEEHKKQVEVFCTIKTGISSLHQEIIELDKKHASLKSQKEFIDKLNVQYQDIPDPVVEGRLITTMPPEERHTGILGKVKEVLYTDSEKCKLFKNGFQQNNDSDQLYEIACEAKFIELDTEQLVVNIEETAKQIAEKTREKEELIAQIEEQEVIIERSEKNIHDQEKFLSILQAQKSDILEEVDKLNSEMELVDSEIAEVKEIMTESKKKEEEMTYHLDTLNQDIGSCQNFIQEKREFIHLKLQEKEETTVYIAQLETELESDEEKQKSQQEHVDMFKQSLDRELEEIKRLEDEGAESGRQKVQYENEINELKVKIEDLKKNKESIKSVLVEHEKEKGEVTSRLEGFRSHISGVEEEINEIKQKIHDQQMKNQEISFTEQGIKDRLAQTYKIDIDNLKEDEIPQEEDDQAFAPGTEEFNKALERLKKRCDSFGSVNLVAIEEFEELKERFEFLTKQQSDLLEAKESLMSTIRKINRQTRQMFMETFTRVSEEFRIYFRMLFGGGQADLVLLDPDNVLESGIEIVARPPGKKLQSISLLSGGEKTLTAIALIFGVFKVKPSPFCILDEIDAALDDSNVGRFSYLLKDFAKIAQFIVITHNKKTIASSDVMYGVTMQEKGVSKIVSVKFAEDGDQNTEKEAAVVVG